MPFAGLADFASAHLAGTLFVTLVVFVYRDVWPLCTYPLAPADEAGIQLWTKIALLLVAGFIVPMATPRRYVPQDPEVEQFDGSPIQLADVFL